MFNPSRDEARNFLFETWRKKRQNELLSPLEDLLAQMIEKHPEFHDIFSDKEKFLDTDYLPEHGNINPFLHVMMHLSIEEQISIDQPEGVRQHFFRLREKMNSEHEAQHAMMECLGEMILQAQKNQTQPDPSVYLDCLARC